MNRRKGRLFVFAVFLSAAVLFLRPVDAYAAKDSRKLNKEANALFLKEDYRGALDEYEKILSENNEENFQAEYGKAMCLVKLEHYYQALEQLQYMNGTDEKEMLAVSDAGRQIKNALCSHPNEDVISYYRNRIRNVQSFATAQIILSDYPDYPQTEYYQALFYTDVFTKEAREQADEQVLEELCQYFEEIRKSYPWQEDFKSFYESMMALRIDRCFVNGETEAAEQLTDQMLKKNPGSAKFLSCKGELLYERKKYKEAETYLRRAINQDELLLSAYENLMRTLYRQKKYEETAETADTLLALDEGNIYAYAYLGLSYEHKGEKEKSSSYIQKVQEAPSDYNKVCALTLIGSRREAVQLLKELSEKEPSCLVYARFDHDLKRLHLRPSFRKLVSENYTEEFANIYAALLAVAGAALYLFLFYRDFKKSRKIQMFFLFVTCSLLFAIGLLEPVYARNFALGEAETAKISGENDTTEEFTEEDVCHEEIEWFTEQIRLGLRTVLALYTPDTESAAELVKAATVNVQATLAGSIYGQGSGVVVSYKEDEIIIIGCRHTLYTDCVRVRFTDGTYAPAEIIGKSEAQDFMALRVDVEDVPEETLSYIKKANIDYQASKELSVSDAVLSNGYITTKGYMYFDGSVTNLRKSFSDFEPYYTNHVPYLLTDTKAAAGTSGGGTFDAYGNFLGLQAGIVLSTNERYVVPLDTVAQEYEQITGEVLE